MRRHQLALTMNHFAAPFLALLAVPCTLAAQQPARDSTPARALTDTLATVRVTVLRTPLAATRAPYAVSTVTSREATAARPGFALDEVLGGVGGVQVDNRLNFALGERIAIRGIGARAQFGVRGVRVIVDGIPATLADGQTQLNNVDLGSMGGAEVLRGPASALYGNASGGVVLLASAPAPFGAFAPSLRLMRGSDALVRAQVGAGGTRGRATYLLDGDRLDYGGYRAHSTARNAHANAVATYDWDRASLRLVANVVRYDAENPGALSDSLLARDRRQAYAGNVAQHTGERGAQGQYGASGHVVLGPGDLAVSAYGLTRGLDNPIPPRVIQLHRLAGGARAAYSVTVGDDVRSVTALAGAETDLQRDERVNWVNVKGARGARVLDQREHVTSASPFAQITASLDRLTVIGGLRYDGFRFAADDHLVTATNPDDSGVRRMHATSPSLGASYAVMPALAVYANVATAFQTPTTSELANQPTGAGGFNPSLQPEHTHSREVGLKGRVALLSYDVAAYDMRIDDELISFEVPSVAGRQFYRNAGATRHRGGDADISAILAPAVTLHASASIVDAHFLHYTAGGVSYAGNRVPGIAPRSGSVGVELGLPTGRFLAIEERVESATPVTDANDARSPGFAVTNVRAAWHLRDVGVFGGIGNLFDRRYNTSVVINAAGGRYYEPAAGRTVYAGVELVPGR